MFMTSLPMGVGTGEVVRPPTGQPRPTPQTLSYVFFASSDPGILTSRTVRVTLPELFVLYNLGLFTPSQNLKQVILDPCFLLSFSQPTNKFKWLLFVGLLVEV